MRTRRPPLRGFVRAAALIVGVLILAGCSTAPASTLDPQGNHARNIYDLLVPIFWTALAVFVIVEGVLVYSVIRYRQKPDSGIPAQFHGNTRIEVLWTIAPALIVLVIAVLTFDTQARNSVQPTQALQITAVGHQWWFEFRYPEGNIVTGNDLYVPVGQDVTLTLQSQDVIHSFWVPKLAGKTDMIPGLTNRLSFRPLEPGIYRGQCAEFCGEEHALMRFRVIALPPDEFQRWTQQIATAPVEPTGNAANGKLVFQQKACIGCHAIAGNEQAVGVTGPNLTYFGSRTTIAAGVLPNTPENLATWLRDPNAVKPGNIMATVIKPGTLNEQEIADLVAYLEGMKLSITLPQPR